MSEESTEGGTLARQLRQIIDETEADLSRMPFFVRPMARRSFATRTGWSFEEWRRAAERVASEAGDVRGKIPELRKALDRLADNYKTAPERAIKGMGSESALAFVRDSARQREAVVRGVIAWLEE
jgi:hypothetical protein